MQSQQPMLPESQRVGTVGLLETVAVHSPGVPPVPPPDDGEREGDGAPPPPPLQSRPAFTEVTELGMVQD